MSIDESTGDSEESIIPENNEEYPPHVRFSSSYCKGDGELGSCRFRTRQKTKFLDPDSGD